ncbi:MAG: DUF2283 domain-containing protein [Candidatus Ryanbacteria bacterium]|nr:DUF2283 domain-containing protein [Candidatus Ryanbacteria bacterium]
MKIQYDKQADALYIYLGTGRIKKTIKVGGNILADLDSRGRVVGVEFYKISRSVSQEQLRSVSVDIPVGA